MSERDEQGRWTPGTSGNPAGRTPGSVGIRSLIRERLRECPEGESRTLGEQLARAIVADALAHDGQSRRLTLEHLEGRPRQSVEVSKPLVPILKPGEMTDEIRDECAAWGIVPIIDDISD